MPRKPSLMKNKLRSLVPKNLMNFYRKAKRKGQRQKNQEKTTEEVFTEIYDQNRWGGNAGDFYSGGGTADDRISQAYIACIEKLSAEHGFGEMKAVDLGCGDMLIGSQIMNFFQSYVGVDVVRALVEKHRETFVGRNCNFEHSDIIKEDLPTGDVCLIRQVLQHLSNQQILEILKKVSQNFKYIIITEHLPTPNLRMQENLDKAHGEDIRIYDNSGVYLNSPPFSIPSEETEVVLEVEGHGYDNYTQPWMTGVIQTLLYRPGKTSLEEASE